MTGTADNGRLGAATVGVERLFSLSEAEAELSLGFFGSSSRTIFRTFIC